MDLTRSIDTPLGELARQPSAARVFLRHRLDFCCGGRRSLREACAAAGLDAGQIAAELDDAAATPDEAPRWEERPLAALTDHIVARFHDALRRDVPPLLEAARKVERVHAGKPAVPVGLADALAAFWDEMQLHMMKEERVLFPMLRAGVVGGRVAGPVHVMEHEHDQHAAHLARLRTLGGDRVPPAHACATWRALYQGLAHLEEELMLHIHLENHVLFPRARAG